MKQLHVLYGFIGLTLIALLSSCNSIHEFPDQEPEKPIVSVKVNIKTTITDITVTQDITTQSEVVYPQSIDSAYELRLIAEFYKSSDSKLYTRVVQPLHTRDSVVSQSITVDLILDKYYVILWREYVLKTQPDSQVFYQTANGLRSVTMLNPNTGDNDAMDCCFGKADIDLTLYTDQQDVVIEIPVAIKRPVARYILITNDVAKHTEKQLRTESSSSNYSSLYNQTRALINKYTCRVYYQGNALYGFDCYTGKPNDAKAGMYFDAHVELLNDDEARIAFAYPFSFAEGNTIHASLQIFDENGTLIQEIPDVEIPVTQGRLTVIKSDFLTHEYPQGITINQDYDGQFDVVLPD